MSIGERIKCLRKQKNMTQEQLADYLHVSFQAISKWENGISNPDLSLIAPLTDLFHISADELLGLSQKIRDERKAYYEAEYFEYWKKEDHEADYHIVKRAVEEYPSELKYWKWLGAVEYYIAFRRPKQEDFIEMMDSSIKHNLMVWENSTDAALKNEALWTIICAYRYSGRVSTKRCDRGRAAGKQYYTAPLLDHCTYDYSACRELSSEAEQFLDHLRRRKKYNTLRDREDFKNLFS